MSTFFIFLLFLICILLSLFNYKKTSLIAGSIIVLGYIVVGNGFLPAYLLYKLQLPYSQLSSINWKKTNSKNTYQNAKFSSYLLKKQYNEQFFLVSSGLALKRALLYFSFFKIYPKPIASDFITIPITKYPLGYNFAMNDFAIHEYIGILRFHIYNFFGWNKE